MKITDIESTLTAELLRIVLEYNEISGQFTWKVPPKNQSIEIGDVAGYLRSNGYWYIKIGGRSYSAHRLAWMYVHGVWPPRLIDHINGVKSDNRIANLRPASMSQNKSNGALYASNSSGFKGVTKCKNKWKTQITHDQVVFYLGLFNTKEEAHEAYLKAASERHGDFARAA